MRALASKGGKSATPDALLIAGCLAANVCRFWRVVTCLVVVRLLDAILRTEQLFSKLNAVAAGPAAAVMTLGPVPGDFGIIIT